MKTSNTAKVLFPDWYDERGEWEAESKGWLPGLSVELPDGRVFPVYFYDPTRLAQDLAAETSARQYIAEPGLIVIPKITKMAISEAVEFLYRDGFFENFRPINHRADSLVAL